jgi:hypothetical protein
VSLSIPHCEETPSPSTRARRHSAPRRARWLERVIGASDADAHGERYRPLVAGDDGFLSRRELDQRFAALGPGAGQ